MHIDNIAIFFILVYTFISCTDHQLQFEKENKTVISVNPLVDDSLSVDDVYTDISIKTYYLPDSLVIGEATSSYFIDSQLVVLDKIQNSIFVFNKNGELRSHINSVGKGPGEYFSITSFILYDGKLELLDPTGKIVIFDMDGNFIDEIDLQLKHYGIPSIHFISHISKDVYALYSPFTLESQPLHCYNNKNKEMQRYPYVTSFSIRDWSYIFHFRSPFITHKNEALFYESYGRNVYSLKPNQSVNLKYQWDFGAYNLDLASLDHGLDNDAQTSYLKNLDKVIAIRGFGETDKTIVLDFEISNEFRTLFYNKSDKKYSVLSNFNEGISTMLFGFPRETNSDNLYYKVLDVEILRNPVPGYEDNVESVKLFLERLGCNWSHIISSDIISLSYTIN